MKLVLFIYGIAFWVFAISLTACKPNKGFDDPSWKEESQKMAISLCQHFQSCLKDSDWKAIPEKWRSLAQSRIQEGNCQNEFRKSNIFFLKVPDPNSAKEAYTKCTTFTLALSCEQLKNKEMELSTDCTLVNSLQSGSH